MRGLSTGSRFHILRTRVKENRESSRNGLGLNHLRRTLLRAVLVAVTLTVGLAIAELFLRWIEPPHFKMVAQPLHFGEFFETVFDPDPEFGYMPRVGPGEIYSSYGCLPNDYDPEDRGGRQRLLFIGDSVTHRARIIEALRELYGDQDYEYWNAGVEGFNTAQELEFYRRHNTGVRPDHVILTFHNNDFMATPMAVKSEGKVKIYSPLRQLSLPPRLLDRSALVRRVVRASMMSRNVNSEQVKVCLAELEREVVQSGARFSVVLFPILRPVDDWNAREKLSREQALKILEELELRSFDLMPALEEALAQGLPVQESEGDRWHPSDQAASRFARELKKAGLLE